jgi:hypothetical protein
MVQTTISDEEITIDEFIDYMTDKLNSYNIMVSRSDVVEKVQKILYDGDTYSGDSAHQIILTYLPYTEIGKFKNRVD